MIGGSGESLFGKAGGFMYFSLTSSARSPELKSSLIRE